MHTFFKTPDGNLYAVSERVMNLHVPAEGVILASDEDITAHQQKQKYGLLMDEEKIAQIKQLLQDGILPKEPFTSALLSIEAQKAENIELEKLRAIAEAERIADEEAKRISAEEAAEKAKKLAEAQAEYKQRQIEIETRREIEKVAQLEINKIAKIEADRIAKIEAEKQAKEDLKARKLAAIEAKGGHRNG